MTFKYQALIHMHFLTAAVTVSFYLLSILVATSEQIDTNKNVSFSYIEYVTLT